MKKKLIIVDYDSTLVNSHKAFCEIYNELYKDKEGFIPANWREVKAWNFVDQCSLLANELNTIEKVKEIFSMQEFFDRVECYDGVKKIIQQLQEHARVVICTAGTHMNISRKVLHLKQELPSVSIIPVIDESGFGKELVNMQGAIFIDDHEKNLKECNASIKICYAHEGVKLPWNESWKGLILTEWNNKTYESLVRLLKQL